MLAVLMAGSDIVVRTSGQIGLDVFGAAAGLADVDVDVVVISVIELLQEYISVQHAASTILVAVASNQLFKLTAAMLVGRPGFARRLSGLPMTAVTAGGLAPCLRRVLDHPWLGISTAAPCSRPARKSSSAWFACARG